MNRRDAAGAGVVCERVGSRALVAAASASGGSLVNTGVGIIATTGVAGSLLGTAIAVKRRRVQPTVRKIKVTFLD